MLFHTRDHTFKRLASAQKRIEHFAQDGVIDYSEPLAIQYSNMMAAFPSGDYSEQLELLDWIASKINTFCDNNKVSESETAKAIFAKLKPLFFADFTILANKFGVNA